MDETIPPSQPVSTPTQKPLTKTNNATLMGVLAYVSVLVLVPYVMEKQDPFVKFHVQQGLALALIEVAVWLLGSLLGEFWYLLQIVNLATLILSIIGIINVINHKEAELPLIGSYAKNLKF